MFYYRRYFALYLGVSLALLACTVFESTVDGSRWPIDLLLTAVCIFFVALICNLRGLQRYQAMRGRFFASGDAVSFRVGLEGCRRAANRSTRNSILCDMAYLDILEGRFAEASATLRGLNLDSARQKRLRLNDHCAYDIRCAQLAILCGQPEAARPHLEALARELTPLKPGDTLRTHYSCVLLEYRQVVALLTGEEGAPVAFFETLLSTAGDTMTRSFDGYYLALALQRRGGEGDAARARELLTTVAAALPNLIYSKEATARLADLPAAQ